MNETGIKSKMKNSNKPGKYGKNSKLPTNGIGEVEEVKVLPINSQPYPSMEDNWPMPNLFSIVQLMIKQLAEDWLVRACASICVWVCVCRSMFPFCYLSRSHLTTNGIEREIHFFCSKWKKHLV